MRSESLGGIDKLLLRSAVGTDKSGKAVRPDGLVLEELDEVLSLAEDRGEEAVCKLVENLYMLDEKTHPLGAGLELSGLPTKVLTRGPSGQTTAAVVAMNWIRSAMPMPYLLYFAYTVFWV